MVTRTVVQSAMHTAATALVHLPPDEWAGWVAYMLQTLEEMAASQGVEYDAEAVIEEALRTLQARLAEGEW